MARITGNTYPVREQLKALGGQFERHTKSWDVPESCAAEAWALVGVDPIASRDKAVAWVRDFCGAELDAEQLDAVVELCDPSVWGEYAEMCVEQRLLMVAETSARRNHHDPDGFGDLPKTIRKAIGAVRQAISEAGIAREEAE